MKKRTKSTLSFLVLFYAASVMVLSSCKDGGGDNALPIETKKWVSSGDGFTQFYTNDSKNCNYSFWDYYDNATEDVFEIKCKKISGSEFYGFGMVFGFKKNLEGKSEYYLFSISTNGYFDIWLYKDGKFANICESKKSEKIKKGYGQLNKLRVERSDISFDCFINDSYVASFENSVIKEGDKIGFFAEVGLKEYENFPGTPVDVRFKK